VSARNPWNQLPPKPEHPDTAALRELKALVSRALVIWLEVDARGSVTAEDWTRIGEVLSEAGLPAEWKP
jgi:hypothetical protein